MKLNTTLPVICLSMVDDILIMSFSSGLHLITVCFALSFLFCLPIIEVSLISYTLVNNGEKQYAFTMYCLTDSCLS